MEDLKEIVNLVTSRKSKKIETIDFETIETDNNLYNKFLISIQKNQITNDEEASRQLYNASPKDKKFLMLKGRLRDRLINTIYFLDFNRKDDPTLKKTIYKVYKVFFAARILANEGAHISAEILLKKNIQEAITCEISEMVFSYSKLLRSILAQKGNKKQFHFYSQIAEKYSLIIQAENRSEFIYRSMGIEVSKSESKNKNILPFLKKGLEEGKAISKKFPNSFTILMFNYRIELLYYQVKNDYAEVLNTCRGIEKLLNKYPHFSSDQRRGEVYLLRMVSYFMLRKFEEGKENYFESIKLFREGTLNWFYVLEHYFRLAMHTGNYEEAYDVFMKAKTNPRFTQLPEAKVEQWSIYEAYVHFVREEKGNFNVLKFVNNLPIYTKDKKGNYPAILIAQIIHLLKSQKEDEALERVESLRKSVKRYMNSQKSMRTLLFVRLLKKVEHRYLGKEAFFKKYSPLLDKLKQIPINDPRNSESIEVVPYENLWELILNLKKR